MSLWNEARDQFVQQLRSVPEDPLAIEKFLQDKASVDDARRGVATLREDSDRKYGMNESRGKGVSGKWIRRIMENLNQITTFGNVAMIAAPESVGVVWFAVEKVLSAIQNDYNLYGTFNVALHDISEMMVLVRTYDEVFQDRRGKGDGSIFHELSKSILEVYISILDFSYAVRKYLSGGKRAKIGHALKDVVGASNRQFEGKTTALQAQKAKVIQYSEAAFQQKTSDSLGDVSGELVGMQKTMRDVFEFHQRSSTEMKEILSEIKTANRAPTHGELAVLEYDKNMQRLTPWLDAGSATLSTHVKAREEGTCTWIKDAACYTSWQDASKSSILCIRGETSSGKSVLGAFVYETLRNELSNSKDKNTLVQYISQDIKSTGDIEKALKRMENTLLRQIYEHALDDVDDDLLLQRCNILFSHPKKSKGRDNPGPSTTEKPILSGVAGGQTTLDFLDVYPSLVESLKKRIVVIIDGVDDLLDEDQAKFAENLVKLRQEPDIHVRILLLCRPSSPIRLKLGDETTQITMADHNLDDIRLIISRGLEILPGLSSDERSEIEAVITQKTGHRIRYVKQVALPFLHTPFQRPVTTWLQSLPENVNETYHQHLRQLAPNYYDLLRLALSVTFVAERQLRIDEIMEIYSRMYLNDSTTDDPDKTQVNLELYRKQILKAGGPFLNVRENNQVELTDPEAIREFCRPKPNKAHAEDAERSMCLKCRQNTHTVDALPVDERHAHLALAITCMKHLNSNTFHVRFFADSLDEARSRVVKEKTANKDTVSDVNLETAGSPQNLASTTESNQLNVAQAGDSDSKNEQQEALLEIREAATSSPNEVSDDDSQFSDQEGDNEDFDQADNDDWDDNSDWWTSRRYEITSWYYNIQEAERLWSPDERKSSPEWQELLKELERFFLDGTLAFEAWKLDWVNYSCEKWEPLHFAACHGLMSVTQMLLDRGAKVMGLTPDGWSALHLITQAPKPSQAAILRLFLQNGGDPNVDGEQESWVMPAFHHWLYNGADPECVKELLRSGASNSLTNSQNQNVMHYFALDGADPEVLYLLLDNPLDANNRADINVEDGDGETPLHRLLSRPKVPIDLLRAFLARGANVNIDDKQSERPLYEAARWGENDAVEAIIEQVTDIDDDSRCGQTALHGAAHAGHKETVELLLKHGSDPNRRDKHNRSPLFLACLGRRGFIPEDVHQETAELLFNEQMRRRSAFHDINVCTKRGRTTLREAAGRGYLQIVSGILEQMAPEEKVWIDKRDDRKRHSRVARTGEVIEILLQHGANVLLRDGVDGKGMTSLEICLDRWAVIGSNRYENAMVRLIDACTDEAKGNKLLLTTAAIHGSVQVLGKLANAGVNLDLPDAYGWTPSQLASQFDHFEAAAFIRGSLAKRALRPTQWTVEGDAKITTLEDDGRGVNHEESPRMCILADHPVPAGLTAYYYEIEILDAKTGKSIGKNGIMPLDLHLLTSRTDSQTQGNEDEPEIAMGFATASAKLVEFPGWPPKPVAPNVQSWAYHADDGAICASNRKKWPSSFDKHYGPGDTVGCGLEVEAKRIFFTRNGVRIDDHVFEDFNGRVFPIIGLSEKMKLRTNFGLDPQMPFKWNQQAEETSKEVGEKLVNGTGS
ncbi:uncharacterized protein KY384_000281 [Bacidia gigantensis]|uniref:uncharacterized protein n=1 Tax=Bacidia gigantensis TaxID=2732470 RepID=UPI001D049634|nr:uncharacterized protein KY384_000281 [Bacidia gigantensis]KAG8526288.1 hypothetical protein KY384_000281 [Bacidia gigantensis]